jgi:hypothetical protein
MFRSICNIPLTKVCTLQSIRQELIWNAARAGDTVLLDRCLVGATAEDFLIDKIDEVDTV